MSRAIQVDGAGIIAAERARQIAEEGWDASHDDDHTDGSLALAGAIYAWPSPRPLDVKRAWPWARRWWKPTCPEMEPVACGCRSVGECPHMGEVTVEAWRAARIRDLTKAGALIAAEIDRLQRAARTVSPTTPAVPDGEQK